MDGWYEVNLWGSEGILGCDSSEPMSGYGSLLTFLNTAEGKAEWTRQEIALSGKGAHTKGRIHLNAHTTIYVCVGGRSSTFNYGGRYHINNIDPDRFPDNFPYGSGATDIRLDNSSNPTMIEFNSLKSRIMVAAAGGAGWYSVGGFYERSLVGSAGGGITSKPGDSEGSLNGHRQIRAATGAGQTYGSVAYIGLGYMSALGDFKTEGSFGQIKDATYQSSGGAGGYYFGNISIGDGSPGSAAGGSSFISGYPGCNAIASYATENVLSHTGQPNHYSGYVFDNTYMLTGESLETEPDGTTSIGHRGNGYARIMLLNRD